MRRSRLIIEWRLIPAALAFAAAAGPALAGQPAAGFGPPDGLPGLSPPAESGKPAFGAERAAPLGTGETGGCMPALPCGTRLFGTIRKNGAVELQVPALRW